MLRIAILCEFGTVNGGERSLLAALRSLAGRVEPVVLCPAQGRLSAALRVARVEHHSFDVRTADGIRRSYSEILDDLAAVVACIRPNLLHANSLSMGRLTGALVKSLPIPCTAHLRDMLRLTRAALADLTANARLFAVSHAVRDFYLAQECPPERIEVLYNGVDLAEFHPPDSPQARTDLLRELGLPSDTFLALTIGQIGLRKGLNVLARAAPEIVRRVPNAQFLIVGERYSEKAESIAFEQDFVASFDRHGLRDRLHRVGYRSDIPRLLCAADILIHSAHQEPLGRVLLEAAASALAIVATDVGGTSEILIHGESALLVPPKSPEALAAAVVEVANDADQRQRLGVQARQSVAEKFDLSTRTDALHAAWCTVLEESRRAGQVDLDAE